MVQLPKRYIKNFIALRILKVTTRDSKFGWKAIKIIILTIKHIFHVYYIDDKNVVIYNRGRFPR